MNLQNNTTYIRKKKQNQLEQKQFLSHMVYQSSHESERTLFSCMFLENIDLKTLLIVSAAYTFNISVPTRKY